ncbi:MULTISPECIES: Lrp/AsnC family transcriptional regulator [Clostridium]|uniref:Lrp/AsnC family transcriptional regulator n=1 Tax=Clostridium cibarium TaxID=2762247 RepID=A0ABR8PYW8_9CLOT|nr:Lrp/AsnC family transcriptional regulator [Clostridium sp. HBUAS56017]MBD7913353.1 Lrp/AsnC family transcriptional regulator [Clostridium cibarium]
MDKVDLKIIKLLQENARYPLKKLSEEVFLTAAAISARIEKLEKAGVITGYHASINELELGYNIVAFINLTMTPELKAEFCEFIQACPNVIECNCVSGNYSMVIKVAYQRTVELDVLISHLQKYGNTETQIVFSTPVKFRGISIMDFQ